MVTPTKSPATHKIYTRVNSYTFSLLPLDHPRFSDFSVQIKLANDKGHMYWLVTRGASYLNHNGEWHSIGTLPHIDDMKKDWWAERKFDFDTAVAMAHNALPDIKDRTGLTAQDLLRAGTVIRRIMNG